MKKLLIFALALVVFASCSKTPEEKAQSLVEDAVKKSPYKPDSYDPVETKIDSAFSPHATQEYIEGTFAMCKAYNDIDKYADEAESAKSSMSIWSSPYSSAFGRNEYRKAKAEYENALKEKKAAETKMNEEIAKLKEMEKQERSFIGYSVIHRYRAETNGGQVAFGTIQFLLDKDMENVLATFDLDSYEFKEMQETLEKMAKDEMFK